MTDPNPTLNVGQAIEKLDEGVCPICFSNMDVELAPESLNMYLVCRGGACHVWPIDSYHFEGDVNYTGIVFDPASIQEKLEEYNDHA